MSRPLGTEVTNFRDMPTYETPFSGEFISHQLQDAASEISSTLLEELPPADNSVSSRIFEDESKKIEFIHQKDIIVFYLPPSYHSKKESLWDEMENEYYFSNKKATGYDTIRKFTEKKLDQYLAFYFEEYNFALNDWEKKTYSKSEQIMLKEKILKEHIEFFFCKLENLLELAWRIMGGDRVKMYCGKYMKNPKEYTDLEIFVENYCKQKQFNEFAFEQDRKWANKVDKDINLPILDERDEVNKQEFDYVEKVIYYIFDLVQKAQDLEADFKKDLNSKLNHLAVGSILANGKVQTKMQNIPFEKAEDLYYHFNEGQYPDLLRVLWKYTNQDQEYRTCGNTPEWLELKHTIGNICAYRRPLSLNLKDLLRATIFVQADNFAAQYNEIQKIIKSNYKLYEVKKNLGKNTPFYSVFIIFQYQDIVAELQVIPSFQEKDWAYIKKQKISHALYDIRRAGDTGGAWSILRTKVLNYQEKCEKEMKEGVSSNSQDRSSKVFPCDTKRQKCIHAAKRMSPKRFYKLACDYCDESYSEACKFYQCLQNNYNICLNCYKKIALKRHLQEMKDAKRKEQADEEAYEEAGEEADG